ncbi:MAG: transposase [Desertimonas sp.]
MPKPFPAEFRDTVVAAALASDQPRARIASEFGVSESCLHRWLPLHNVDNGGVDAVTRADAAEARELRRRVKVLEEENLILRRAAAFFAREITPR